MTAKKTQQKKGGGGQLLLSVALGAALAAGAGYYAAHKEEIDREAKKKIDELAKLFKETRAEVEKRVTEVWGEVSHEAIATYMDLRGALLDLLENEEVQKTGKLLQKNYNAAVEQVIRSARKSGVLTPDVEKKLAAMFRMDWEDVEKIFRTGMKTVGRMAEKGMRDVKKTVKKTVKKAAPKKKSVSRKTAPKKTMSKKTAKRRR